MASSSRPETPSQALTRIDRYLKRLTRDLTPGNRKRVFKLADIWLEERQRVKAATEEER